MAEDEYNEFVSKQMINESQEPIRIIEVDYTIEEDIKNNRMVIHLKNGAILLKDFGCNAAYYIKTYNTRPPYVYTFKINLKTDEYGLKVPPALNENKRIIPLTESHIRHIVRETLRQYLQL